MWCLGIHVFVIDMEWHHLRTTRMVSLLGFMDYSERLTYVATQIVQGESLEIEDERVVKAAIQRAKTLIRAVDSEISGLSAKEEKQEKLKNYYLVMSLMNELRWVNPVEIDGLKKVLDKYFDKGGYDILRLGYLNFDISILYTIESFDGQLEMIFKREGEWSCNFRRTGNAKGT